MPSWVEPDRAAWLHAPRSDADWRGLRERYGAAPDDPLARVLALARANRCRTIVEENRYVDPDFRSEYSAFWSERFAHTPAFARRLHFFRRSVDEEELHRLRPEGYLGYSTLKPIGPQMGSGRVGRTVLSPPKRLEKAVLTLATDRVSLFGTTLEVTGAPFYEQDGEFLCCAHASAWMCHYAAHLNGLAGRRLTAQLVEMSPSAFTEERDLPSPGLTLNQIQAIFASTGQPALFYGLSKLPEVEGVENPKPIKGVDPGYWDTRIFSIVCRYLNAGYPVLIGTRVHAFVIVGWFREGKKIRFVACDDQWGPYEVISSPFTDRRAPWKSIMVPLPPKVYLSGESAESTAALLIRAYGKRANAFASWRRLFAALAADKISLRTFLRSNAAYKAGVIGKGRGSDLERSLRLARLPHWVWVVEAQDPDKRAAARPCVLAEFVFDSTSNDRHPDLCAFSIPEMAGTYPPDGGEGDLLSTPDNPWESHLLRKP